MAPNKLKTMTLTELRKAFLAMMSPQWDIALTGQPKEEITKAAQSLLALQRARLRLGNMQLRDIKNKLIENEAALKEGKDNLKKSLENLDKVQDVINAVNGLVKIVSGIVDLAG